ncbi:hypothetical protein M3Y98_00049400 [Aphelenchoides besseyi]|nr:hypothetical protein M3Y98_00049400 [Aphelenchoides besseyi]
MNTRYKYALKDEIVYYVSYLLNTNSQKAEMTEEQLRKRYVTEYGRQLKDDLSISHMSIVEVLALARAKNVSQRSNVSETVVEKPSVPQKQEVNAVSKAPKQPQAPKQKPKAPEQQSKAVVQEEIVVKEVAQKQSIDKPSLLSEKDRAKILAAVDESSVDDVFDDSSSERNTPISNISSDIDDYLIDEPPRRKVNEHAAICFTPQPSVDQAPQSPVKKVVQPSVDKDAQSPVKKVLQPSVDKDAQSPVKKALQPSVDKDAQSPVKKALQPSVDKDPQSPVKKALQPSVDKDPQSPVKKVLQPSVDKDAQSPVKKALQPSVDKDPQSPVKKVLQPSVDKDPQSPVDTTPQSPVDKPSPPTPQAPSQSTPKATLQPTTNEQLNSRLSHLSVTSPMSYKSGMTGDHFISMSPHPARLSAAREMHNVVQQIILDVEQSIKNGCIKIQECLYAAEKNVPQSLTSEEFYRCYSKCIPERQRLTCVQLQRLMFGLVDAANRIEEVHSNEI